MTKSSKPNWNTFFIGFASFLSGLSIIFRGTIWNLGLGNERYLVGGIAIFFGIYCLALGAKQYLSKNRTNKNNRY